MIRQHIATGMGDEITVERNDRRGLTNISSGITDWTRAISVEITEAGSGPDGEAITYLTIEEATRLRDALSNAIAG